MIEKAKVKAPAKLKDDKRMSFKVKFKTPITVQNQWMGLYHAESDGGLPIDMNSVLAWVYTGCNNQEGNQSDESCVEEKKKGAVNFVLDQQLKKGSYRACVHFAINEPFDLFKCSEEIKVVTSPTESPSASPISLSPTDSPTESPSAYPTSLMPTVSPIFSPQCPIHEITMIDRQTSCSSYAYQNGFYRNRFREGCNKFVELDGNFDGCINHCNTCNESACRAACRNGCNYMICEGDEGRFGCNNPPPVAWETCPGLLTKRGSSSAEEVINILSSLHVSPGSLARDKASLPKLLSCSPAALFRLIAFLSGDAVRMPVDKIGPFIRRSECSSLLDRVAPLPRLVSNKFGKMGQVKKDANIDAPEDA